CAGVRVEEKLARVETMTVPGVERTFGVKAVLPTGSYARHESHEHMAATIRQREYVRGLATFRRARRKQGHVDATGMLGVHGETHAVLQHLRAQAVRAAGSDREAGTFPGDRRTPETRGKSGRHLLGSGRRFADGA